MKFENPHCDHHDCRKALPPALKQEKSRPWGTEKTPPGVGRTSLFLAQDGILDLVHQALLGRGLLVVVVRDGAAVLLGLAGRRGLGRVGLEDVAGAAPAAVLCGAALSALNPVSAVSGRDSVARDDVATYGLTSWSARVSAASVFLAMLPVPPRPVVTTDVLRVGVSRSVGWILADLLESTMLPAPPRPEEARLPLISVVYCSKRGTDGSETQESPERDVRRASWGAKGRP